MELSIAIITALTGVGLIWLIRILTVQTLFLLSPRQTKVALMIYLVWTGLFLITMGLSFFDIYWRGYNSTRIILLAAFTSGIFFYWFRTRGNVGRFGSVLLPVLLSIAAPICAVVIWDGYSRTPYSLYYNDNRYRLETTFKGILAAAALPDLFVKHGLIERRYKLSGEYLAKDEVDKIEIEEHEKMVTVVFFHSADTRYGLTNPFRVHVNIE